MNIMHHLKHLFVPYFLSVLAKEKGFNELCLAKYISNTEMVLHPISGNTISNYDLIRSVTAPLYQQLIDWFLKKGVIIRINDDGTGYELKAIEWDEYISFNTLDEALDKAFKLIH